MALCRVRFVGGSLAGAVLDLPADLADARPDRLTVTTDGRVLDRHCGARVPGARVVELPRALRARTVVAGSAYL